MSWKILDMQHKTSDGFVVEVLSCYEVQDGQGYARKTFNQEFEGTTGPGFIPYEDLTEETVISWVKEDLGAEQVAATEAEVAAAALVKKQELEAPEVEGGVPWEDNSANIVEALDGINPL